MKKLLLFGLSLVLFTACSSDDDLTPQTEIPQGEGNVQLQSEVNDFIWRGMNHWYFWQSDVADLADDRFADTDELHTYLNGFSSSEGLFDELVFEPGVTDDFSWYIDDVDAQLNAFRGISESYGMGLGFLVRTSAETEDVVIYVTFVTPNSPADAAGIERGDLIYKVDGTVMNTTNFDVINNVFRNTSVTLGFGSFVDNVFIPEPNDIPLTAELITSNPIQHFEVLEEGGRKIGYLVYNGFRATFHGELNDVFESFRNEGIDELILDLRYNGGGSVLTSAFLASMINGNVPEDNDAVARLQYNDKRDADNGVVFPFFDDISLFDKTTSEFLSREPAVRLTNIDRLYIITTTRTASASEIMINGLRPFMPVITIGETTVGKNEGSITVVDAPASGNSDPFTDFDNRNPNHNIGMQPIVFQVFNNNNESDYTFGFEPEVLVEEFRFAQDIRPFGDPDEALLRATLDHMLGNTAKNARVQPNRSVSKMKDGALKQPRFGSEMYMLPGEMESLKQ